MCFLYAGLYIECVKWLFSYSVVVCSEMKSVAVYCMCEMWDDWFCGYPCRTNEPAELAGGIGGSVDWSRAECSLVHWACDFPVGGPAIAAEKL